MCVHDVGFISHCPLVCLCTPWYHVAKICGTCAPVTVFVGRNTTLQAHPQIWCQWLLLYLQMDGYGGGKLVQYRITLRAVWNKPRGGTQQTQNALCRRYNCFLRSSG